MTTALFLIFPITSLLWFPFAFEEFETTKTFALISFACFAGFFVDWSLIKKDVIAAIFTAFVLSAIVSGILSNNWHVAIWGNPKCRSGILVLSSYLIFYLGILEYFEKFKTRLISIDIILICSFLIGVYTILQVLGLDFKQWYETLNDLGYMRPISFLGHPNFMANYLAMTLPFCFWRIEFSRSIYLKAILAINAIISVASIWLSLSRGMCIAAIIGIGVYFLINKKSRKYLLYIATGIALIIAVSLTTLPIFNGIAKTRIDAFFKPGIVRLEYPIGAFRIWKKYPIFGYGTDNYELGFQHQRTDEYWRLQPFGTPHRAHNDFLNILATQGALGGLMAILLTVFIFIKAMFSGSRFLAPACASISVFYVAGLSSFFISGTVILFLFSILLLSEDCIKDRNHFML